MTCVFQVIVQRILTEHLPCMKDLARKVCKHIQHDRSAQMATKSHVINLGVVEANPASTALVLDIMDHLKQYVPVKEDGQVHTVPCNGDQLTVERMTHAKRARVVGPDPSSRLEGLCETPQEFHKEGILLQVCHP